MEYTYITGLKSFCTLITTGIKSSNKINAIRFLHNICKISLGESSTIVDMIYNDNLTFSKAVEILQLDVKYKTGEILQIVNNFSGHGFAIGEQVVVISPSPVAFLFDVKNLNDRIERVHQSDLYKLPNK